MKKKTLDIFLVAPRGFCAGVERAVNTVEKAITEFGIPIYVKHQIVHNKRIIEDLSKKGVIFINNLEDVPDNSVLIFNAHGVTQEFEISAKNRNILCIDATCPLVKKVHKEAGNYIKSNKTILIIGHKNHPEVVATKSRITNNPIIIENTSDASNFIPKINTEYAFVTQTTLSVDYINQIIAILKEKIPNLSMSKNICYATQNRQDAIKHIIKDVDGLIIVGSNNSSNSNRLKEIGDSYCVKSYLIDDIEHIPFEDLKNMKKLAISAGASSPSYLINEIINEIRKHIDINLSKVEIMKEDVSFILPKFPKNNY